MRLTVMYTNYLQSYSDHGYETMNMLMSVWLGQISKNLNLAYDFDDYDGMLVVLEQYQNFAKYLFDYVDFDDPEQSKQQKSLLKIVYKAQQACWQGIKYLDGFDGIKDSEGVLVKTKVASSILKIYCSWNIQGYLESKKLLDNLFLSQKNINNFLFIKKYLISADSIKSLFDSSLGQIKNQIDKLSPTEALHFIAFVTERFLEDTSFVFSKDYFDFLKNLIKKHKNFQDLVITDYYYQHFFSKKYLDNLADTQKQRSLEYIIAKEKLLEIWSSLENLLKFNPVYQSEQGLVFETKQKIQKQKCFYKNKDFGHLKPLSEVKNMAVTGSFWLKPAELLIELKQFNIQIISKPEKQTDYLLVGINPNPNQLQKAIDLGIEIIYLQDLFEMLANIKNS